MEQVPLKRIFIRRYRAWLKLLFHKNPNASCDLCIARAWLAAAMAANLQSLGGNAVLVPPSLDELLKALLGGRILDLGREPEIAIARLPAFVVAKSLRARLCRWAADSAASAPFY
jgi:hypothetical protein